MAAKQGFGSALSAEMKRVVFQPRRLITATIFAAAAILLFVGATALVDWGNNAAASGEIEGVEPIAIPAFIGFDMSLSLISFCFGIYASAFVARDYNDGTVMASLLAVPNRGRLFLARLFPWVLLTAVFSLLAFAVVGALGINRAGTGEATIIVLQGLLATVSSVFTGIVGFCCGAITKKGSLSVLLFLALFFLIPTVASAAGGFGPEFLQTIMNGINQAMPGNALAALIGIVPLDGATADTWISLGVSIAWVVGTPILSYALFKARGTLGR